MWMFREAIPHVYICSEKSTTVITFLSFSRTRGAIEPNFLSYYYIIEPREVSYFNPATERVVFPDGVFSIVSIRSLENNLWLIRRVSQSTNRFFRGNRDDSWKRIRVIAGSFFRAGTITNGHGRDIRSWATTTSWK